MARMGQERPLDRGYVILARYKLGASSGQISSNFENDRGLYLGILRIFLFSSHRQDRHIYIFISCRISIEFNSNFPISTNYSRLCVTI